MKDDHLPQLCKNLRQKYHCHTLILYGSRARDQALPTSDYDLVGFRARGATIHDARKIRGAFLDIFIYPESNAKPADLLRIRGGKIIFQKKHFGDVLLARVEKIYAKGPKQKSAQEKLALKTWAQKMLVRIKAGGVEADFRRVWLLTALLEDYFSMRGIWYEGPKAAFKWLTENDGPTNRLFERALRPRATLQQIENLVAAVTEKRPMP